MTDALPGTLVLELSKVTEAGAVAAPSGQETVSVSAVQVLHFARSPPESKPAEIQRARFSGVMSFGGSPASQASGEPSASRISWLGCAALGLGALLVASSRLARTAQ